MSKIYKLINKISIKKRSFFFIFSLYSIGFYFAKDYGITWDEFFHRNHGKENLYYIAKNFNILKYFSTSENIGDLKIGYLGYGAFFDSISAIIEKVFSLDNDKAIFIMRHRLNFTFYFLGFFSFFLLIKTVFKSYGLALFGSLFYLFNPRLFAHGFFNVKDSVGQALAACALLPLYLTYKNKSYISSIVSGIICGIAITTRIPIVIIPLLFILTLLAQDLITHKKFILKYKTLKVILVFLLSLVISLYLFWPIIWESPLLSFKKIFFNMKSFQWNSYNYFWGEYVKGTKSPWYYLPTWILITVPIPFVLSFSIGIYTIIKNIYKTNLKNYSFQLFMLLSFLSPLILIIFFNSTLYDGWRHVFFIYPFMAYIMILGLRHVLNIIDDKFKFNKTSIMLILGLMTFIFPAKSIIQMHPHQQVYFNFLAGQDPMNNFEGDYWGSSMKKGLEWILENDNRDSIMIVCKSNMAKKNAKILDIKDSRRLNFKKMDLKEISYQGDYIITNYRGEANLYSILKKVKIVPYDNEVFSIKLNEMKILSVFKQGD